MKRIDFYLDFVSPYAYLAFEQLPKALEGLSYQVAYRPVLLAGLLWQQGQRDPAPARGKRAWAARHTAWLAQTHGIPFQMPAKHPFNPLPLLRLALACASQGSPNRFQCEAIFRHVWQEGAAADDLDRIAPLAAQLKPPRDPDSEEIKAQLRTATEQAIQAGVFGVPTMVVDGELF